MIGHLLIALVFVLLAAILLYPKIGSLLVWPILYVYPHLYLQRMELLPWNIGVDDLFICVFFVIVVVRRNLIERLPVRGGLTLFGALTFFGVLAVADMTGFTWPDIRVFPPACR